MKKIKLSVLSYDLPDKDSTLLFFKSLSKKLNIDLQIVNPRKINSMPAPDVLLFRAGTNSTPEEVLQAIKLYHKTRCQVKIDTTKGLKTCNDKIQQTLLMRRNNILIPGAIIIKEMHDWQKIKAKKLDFPLVIKSQFGFGGDTVHKADDKIEAEKIIKKMLKIDNKIIVQQFIPMKEPKDFRVYMVGGKCPKGAIRIAKKGDFRANLKQGAKKIFFKPSSSLVNLAKKICKIINMDIATVDFLKYKNKYYFLEINDSPGMKNDPKMAKQILVYCLKRFKREVSR